MKDLLAAIGAIRRVPDKAVKATDEVRVYRNSLVHEDAEVAEYIAIADARSCVCTFFAKLPLTW